MNPLAVLLMTFTILLLTIVFGTVIIFLAAVCALAAALDGR